MTDLRALLSRVEKAEGLNVELFQSVAWTVLGNIEGDAFLHQSRKWLEAEAWTDAALALVERMNLGASVVTDPPSASVWLKPWYPATPEVRWAMREAGDIVEHTTPAIALLTALLSALIPQQREDGETS